MKMKSSNHAIRSAAGTKKKMHLGSDFVNNIWSRIPGPRTVFHPKYVAGVSALAALAWLFCFLVSDITYHHHQTQCEDVPTIDKYIEAHKEWLRAELPDILKHNGYRRKKGGIKDVTVGKNTDVDGADKADDYNNEMSNSIDDEAFDEEVRDEIEIPDNNGDDDDHDADDVALQNDDKETADLQIWKEMVDDDTADPALFRNLRNTLKGTLDKIHPAPGIVPHDDIRPFTILSSVNAGFLDFAVNWLLSMKQLGIRHNVSLIAEDPVAYDYLSNRYNKSSTITIIPTSKKHTSSKVLGFFSKEYLQLVNRRADYMLEFLERGVDVLHVDVDEYWFRDPVEFIRAQYDVYDVWSSQGKDGPCPCFLYLKAIPRVISMVKDWSLRMLRKHGTENDQVSLAKVLWRYRVMPYQTGKRINHFKLSHDIFPTGTVFFTPSWWRMNGMRVYVAHANRLGNHEKKTAFFREYRLWLVNPHTLNLPVVRNEHEER